MHTDFDERREFDDERFAVETVHESERSAVKLAFFEAGQFIPVHAPDSDLAVTVTAGSGVVRDGDAEHAVEAGDVLAVPAGEDRGIRASDDERLEATLVVSPPPSDAAHGPVREGLRRGEFDP